MAGLESATQPPTLPVAPALAGADPTLSMGWRMSGVERAALTLGSAMTLATVIE